METRKIIGSILFCGYFLSSIFQMVWLVMSLVYALNHQDIVCADKPHDTQPETLRQHHECTDCIDRQSVLLPDLGVRRSQYHFRHRPAVTPVHNGCLDDCVNLKETLDSHDHFEFWKYPRQFVIVSGHVKKTEAFLCSVFACHFHSQGEPPYSNKSKGCNKNNTSENFANINSKKTKRTWTQPRRDIHTFDLHLGDDNCTAYENFNDSYEYQCDIQDIYVFTFQVRHSFILSFECRHQLTNQNHTYKNIKEECFPGNNHIALINVTELREGLHHWTHLQSFKRKEKAAGQLFTPQSELKATRSPVSNNKVKVQKPFQNKSDPLISENVNNRKDATPLEESKETSSEVGYSILMVIRGILVNRMVNDYGIIENQDATEDGGNNTKAVTIEWVELNDNDKKKCSEEFFYPTIAVYIEGLTVLLTIICAHLSHKHCFRPNYRNHSFFVGCMLSTIICGSLSLSTWPEPSLRTFRQDAYFWVDVACIGYVMLAVLLVIIYQCCIEIRNLSQGSNPPVATRRTRPVLGSIPLYQPVPNSPETPTRQSPRQKSPPRETPASSSLTSPKSSTDQHSGCEDNGATHTVSAAATATVPITDTPSKPLIAAITAVPCSRYGATNMATAAPDTMYGATSMATAAPDTMYGATSMATAASDTMYGATNTATAACDTMYGATSMATAASDIMYGATNMATAACDTMYGATNLATAASNTMYGATNMATATSDTMHGATNTAPAASDNMYGATNYMANGVDNPSQSNSLTPSGSPINLMFYSNPSLASSFGAECNGFLSGQEDNIANPDDDGRPRSDEYFEAEDNESTPLVASPPINRKSSSL